ncbi:hypothetical protein [Streptomyces sp. NPDC059744]|uniref:hypothetical protein n=1 Tax=Streptomyces sp. NPDC059744 TaxID=3346929 RepID=UPI00364E3F5F
MISCKSQQTGGQLLFFPRRTAGSLIPTINRRRLSGSSDFTDVGWCFHARVPSLLTSGLEGYEGRHTHPHHQHEPIRLTSHH